MHFHLLKCKMPAMLQIAPLLGVCVCAYNINLSRALVAMHEAGTFIHIHSTHSTVWSGSLVHRSAHLILDSVWLRTHIKLHFMQGSVSGFLSLLLMSALRWLKMYVPYEIYIVFIHCCIFTCIIDGCGLFLRLHWPVYLSLLTERKCSAYRV